jgi:threonine dehydrogenase-like Zn-dependent dehydrogenase
MKAGVFYSANDLRVEEIAKPTPKSREVLIRVKACGICGTDVHIFSGDKGCFPTPAGTVLGHEFAGIVEEVGENVKGVKAGDRVLVSKKKIKLAPAEMESITLTEDVIRESVGQVITVEIEGVGI